MTSDRFDSLLARSFARITAVLGSDITPVELCSVNQRREANPAASDNPVSVNYAVDVAYRLPHLAIGPHPPVCLRVANGSTGGNVRDWRLCYPARAKTPLKSPINEPCRFRMAGYA
jgi:hypothetical protein